LAAFLGKISSDKYLDEDYLIKIEEFLFNQSGYNDTIFNIKNHNSRTFVYSLANELGVGDNYIKLVKDKSFVFAIGP
jgi:hypothetical protein